MTREQWLDATRQIIALWPHQPPPNESLAAWFADVQDLEREQVVAAIRAYARDGREWPPTGGMLRKRVFELAVDAPVFGDAWALVLKAVRKFGHMRLGEAMAWLGEQHAVLRPLVRQIGWRELCMSEEPDVIRGQARRIYDALVEQTTRDLTLRGLPNSNLAALERVNSPEYQRLIDTTAAQMPRIGGGER